MSGILIFFLGAVTGSAVSILMIALVGAGR